MAASVLVLGASGFVGSHLVARLVASGARVRALSLSGGCDIVSDTLPLGGVDRVFHVAGRTGVAESWKDPLAYFEANAYGTARVIEQCRVSGCALTYLSSFRHEAYSAEAAGNPYLFSKILAEEICGFYAAKLGARITILRATNIYGPGQTTDFLLPHIVSQLLDADQPEIVVKDLMPRRDYLYVDDLVEALLLSGDTPAGCILDVGSGEAYSVEEVIRLARTVSGVNKPYRSTETSRKNEIDETKAGHCTALAALGWKPKVSLQAGLSNLIASMRKCRAPST